MKKLFLIAFLFLGISVFAQSGSLPNASTIPIKWKVGAEKTITQIDSTTTFIDNDILFAAVTKTIFKLKILSLKDGVYEIRFNQVSISSDISAEDAELSESIEIVNKIVQEVDQAASQFQFVFLVDQETGYAFEIKNEKQFLEMFNTLVQKATTELINNLEPNMSSGKRKEIENAINEELQDKAQGILNTVLNTFNYIFQVYDLDYVLGQSNFIETEIEEVDQISYGDRNSTGRIEVRASQNGTFLNHESIFHYDKKAMYEQYVRNNVGETNISIQEFGAFESIKTVIDLRTSWIVSSTSYVDVVMGEVHVKTITRTEVR